MRICLVGGIYARGGSRKDTLRITPETTLEAGLRSEGHQVTTLSHYDRADFGEFDAVHVHHLSWGALRAACDRSRTPFVFTAHDAAAMNGYAEGPFRKRAMRYVLSRADAIVSLSEREAAFYRRWGVAGGAEQRTIPNGIAESYYRFLRANPAGRGQAWQLLYVGQLIPLKGADLLLQALAALPGSLELRLVYQCGTLEEELKRLARELNIASRVQFLGRLDPPQLARMYQSSDLLVLPSATEALPSVITEAMMCGLPFVATATGGIPEQANGFGQLIEDRSAEGVAAGIAKVLGSYGRFQSQAEAMSRYARNRFGIPAMIGRHIELYRELASVEQPRRGGARLAPVNAMVRLALRGKPSSHCTAVSEPQTAGMTQ